MRNQATLKILLAISLAVFLAACQSAQQQQGENEASGANATTATGASGGRRARSRTAAPAESKTETVSVPAGTKLEVRLVDALDTGTTQIDSPFEATLAAPLIAGGREVAPLGSKVTGKVENVISSGRLNRPAELSIALKSLTVPGGDKVALSTTTISLKGTSHKKRNVEMIGGGAAVGALVGAIAGGKKGAAIGGALGAGGGTGAAAYTGKKEIHLAPETKLDFKLAEPVSFTVSK